MNLRPTRNAETGNRLARLQDQLFSLDSLASNVVLEGSLKPCDSRRKSHVPGKVLNVYGMDQSGTVEYRFNSCGYRSEEYRRDAKFRICVIGESHAIGTGVLFEKTFGFRLKAMIADALNLELDEVNLINLAIGGASADYCARTVFRQLPHLAADFVVSVIPRPDRIEFRAGEGFNSFVIGSVDVNNLDKVPASLLGYCEYYNDDVGRLNRLKNILLIQSLLTSHYVEFMIAVEGMPPPGDGFDALDAFSAELDEDRILRHEFFLHRADLAADGTHAGPRTHAAFAIMLLHRFGRLLRLRGLSDLADLVETEASRLMAEDEDFKLSAMARATLQKADTGESHDVMTASLQTTGKQTHKNAGRTMDHLMRHLKRGLRWRP